MSGFRFSDEPPEAPASITAVPVLPDFAHTHRTREFWRTYDSEAQPSTPMGDLPSRRPKDCSPRGCVCPCGAAVLNCYADDPEGPIGSRMTMFDAEPAEGGPWFQNADGRMTYEPGTGSYLLHDCTRPLPQPVAMMLFEAVA